MASHASGALWSQLYVLKDRGYMRNALERAWAAGMKTLVFTVDMPIPGSRYRDNRSGMCRAARHPATISPGLHPSALGDERRAGGQTPVVW